MFGLPLWQIFQIVFFYQRILHIYKITVLQNLTNLDLRFAGTV